VLVGALRIQGQKFSPPCDAKGGFRRIEVLTSPARRRQWSGAEKDRIVAETLELGASVSAALPSSASGGFEPDFVAIVAETASTTIAVETTEPTTGRVPRASAPVIEIKLAGAVARVAVGTDNTLLIDVLRAGAPGGPRSN
jgi:transposase